MRFATVMWVGALAFVLAVGAAIALGAEALVGDVTFTSTAGRVLRLVVGGILILTGLNLLGRLKVPLARSLTFAPLCCAWSIVSAIAIPP